MSVRIGNRIERGLVVNDWSVPFVEAVEQTGGRVLFVLDGRLGFEVSAADFEEAARLVANAIAVALGMPSHPDGDLSDEDRALYFRNLSHGALAPKQLVEITGFDAEETADDR